MSPKSVLITGCSMGGIGSALALSFQSHGILVFATARSLSKISHLSSLPNLHILTLDVTSPSSIASAVSFVNSKTRGAGLDYLINNAGVSYVAPVLDTDIEKAKQIYDVNFWGVLRVTQAFSPLVIKAKGSIVNIGSINGYLNVPWMGVYNASKTGLHILGETLRVELQPFGVRVLTVVTGAVDTEIMRNGEAVRLKEGSLYEGVTEFLERRAKGEDVDGKGKADVFAEMVVGDVLAGRSGKVWRGELAGKVRLLNAVLPQIVIDRVLGKGTGLDQLP